MCSPHCAAGADFCVVWSSTRCCPRVPRRPRHHPCTWGVQIASCLSQFWRPEGGCHGAAVTVSVGPGSIRNLSPASDGGPHSGARHSRLTCLLRLCVPALCRRPLEGHSWSHSGTPRMTRDPTASPPLTPSHLQTTLLSQLPWVPGMKTRALVVVVGGALFSLPYTESKNQARFLLPYLPLRRPRKPVHSHRNDLVWQLPKSQALFSVLGIWQRGKPRAIPRLRGAYVCTQLKGD